MKRLSVFLVLVLALLSVAALTSCGCEASNQADQGGQNSTPNESTGNSSNGSANSGSGSHSGSGSGSGSANNGNSSGSANNGSSSSGSNGSDSLMDDMIIGGQDIVDGVDDAIDDITGNGSDSGSAGNGSSSVSPGLSTYEDMIRNGRVRDNDGFLQNDR